MAVATVTRFQVNPGRQPEFMALVAEAKAIHARLGASVRVWTATAAGPDSGMISYVIEHKDLAAFATFTEKLAADAEWQKFLPKAFSANPTSRAVSAALITELQG